MSHVDRKQECSHSLSSVSLDKLEADYNAEALTNSPTCEFETKENAKAEHTSSKIKQAAAKMYSILKEMAIMLFLALTYAALTNDPPKVSRSPAAFPFFPIDSVVTDWYRGQLSAAIDRARESDIAFVMFYAPWDAESQAMRREFETVARHMNKQITFAAVNCWQPGSECRKQYSKAYNWPVLIVYPSHGKGIQYKGPRTAAHIMKFLMAISKPFIRLNAEAEVHMLLTSHDAVVVGCVDASPGSFPYAVLYTVALQFLEKDPLQEVAFAVITGPNRCFDTSPPTLTLHLWNETLWYPNDAEWRPDSILSWIIKSLHQVNMWITPTGSKSLALSMYMHPGPSLLLFTPRNPLNAFVDYYDLLHEVSLEYYNCNKMDRILLNSLLIHTKRIENYFKYVYLAKSCPLRNRLNQTKVFPSVVTYTERWVNNSCCSTQKGKGNSACLKCDAFDLLKDKLQCDAFQKHLLSVKPSSHSRKCNLENTHIKTSMVNDADCRSAKNLKKFIKKEKCRVANIAQSFFPMVVSNSILGGNFHNYANNEINISGLACKTNSSLTMLAIDSLEHYHFAERLGVDLSLKKHKTAAVIVNEKMETHHIMQDSVNDKTLREFIFNFTTGTLPRALDSLVTVASKHTHVYPHKHVCESSEACVVELSTKTFLPTIQQDKVVMVYYYSKQCSFCNGVSYVYLIVSKMFSSLSSMVFARIDGDLNMLPWEYTMDSYPTIIFFPMRRKAESRVFPRGLPITVPNLVGFILANLDPNVKLHAMWTLCNQTKFEDEKESCISQVRAENLSVIEHTLRAWRSADVLARMKLLYRLQQLRSLNLQLALSPYNAESIEKHFTKLYAAPFRDLQVSRSATNGRNTRLKEEL